MSSEHTQEVGPGHPYFIGGLQPGGRHHQIRKALETTLEEPQGVEEIYSSPTILQWKIPDSRTCRNGRNKLQMSLIFLICIYAQYMPDFHWGKKPLGQLMYSTC